jgi:hypothetical protein
MNLSFEFLLKMTFEVMNKVMNNFKRLGNSTLNELVNENVIPRFLNKILKGQSLLPFFYVCTINLQ